MIDEWKEILKLRLAEMMKIGTRVSWNVLTGTIVEVQPPSGLLATRYKVQWDSGTISDWMYTSMLKVIDNEG